MNYNIKIIYTSMSMSMRKVHVRNAVFCHERIIKKGSRPCLKCLPQTDGANPICHPNILSTSLFV